MMWGKNDSCDNIFLLAQLWAPPTRQRNLWVFLIVMFPYKSLTLSAWILALGGIECVYHGLLW